MTSAIQLTGLPPAQTW